MKLRPWVKIAMAFIIGTIAVSQVFNITGSNATSTEDSGHTPVLHGVVETISNGKAYITTIEESNGVGDVEIENDNYFLGDVVTVSYNEQGEIIKSTLATNQEFDKLVDSEHAYTLQARLKKHGRWGNYK